MQLIADGILVISALVAALYCMVLSRRLRKLTQTDGGLGAAITAMSRQADELNQALVAAKTANEASAARLHAEVDAANRARDELETAIERAHAVALASRSAPHSPPPGRGIDADEAPAPRDVAPPPEPSMGKVYPKPAARSAPPLDGVISAYLDAHRGEDEESLAQRLVAALTAEAGAVARRKP